MIRTDSGGFQMVSLLRLATITEGGLAIRMANHRGCAVSVAA